MRDRNTPLQDVASLQNYDLATRNIFSLFKFSFSYLPFVFCVYALSLMSESSRKLLFVHLVFFITEIRDFSSPFKYGEINVVVTDEIQGLT